VPCTTGEFLAGAGSFCSNHTEGRCINNRGIIFRVGNGGMTLRDQQQRRTLMSVMTGELRGGHDERDTGLLPAG